MNKLLLLTTILATVSLATVAQTSPIKVGIKAGASFPNFTLSGPGSETESASTSTSFYVGSTVDISISETFSIQPGILLIGKGAKSSKSVAGTTEEGVVYSAKGKVKINPYYIEIPVNLIANLKTNSGSFFVGAGPYYALGVAGKVIDEFSFIASSSLVENKVSEDIKFGDHTDSNLKSNDFGINFLIGYELPIGLNIHTGYGLGLSNLNTSNSDTKTRNKVISLGLGFSF